jgi:hypothetical protein
MSLPSDKSAGSQELAKRLEAALPPERLAKIRKLGAKGALPSILSDADLGKEIRKRFEQVMQQVRWEDFGGEVPSGRFLSNEVSVWAREQTMERYQAIAEEVHEVNNDVILAWILKQPKTAAKYPELVECYVGGQS